MDEGNDQGNQQATPTKEVPAYPPSEPVASQPTTAPVGNGGIHSKKLLIAAICVIVAALLTVGTLWYLTLSSSGGSSTHEDSSSDQSDEVAFSQPDQIIYYRGNGKEVPRQLYVRPVGSTNETSVLKLSNDISSVEHNVAIYNNQIAFSVAGNYETDDKGAVYYSNDSGKSYKKVYTPATIEEGITSLIFSTDGKALILAILPSVGGKNQVTELPLEGDGTTKTLFTLSDSGVFLKGYDRDKQQAIYFSGCYNCDGYAIRKLYKYDISAGGQETIYQTDSLLRSAEVSPDFSKVLALKASLGDGYYAIQAPYDLFTIDIATKTTEAIKTFDDGEALYSAGYTPEGDIYLVAPTRIRQLANGELSTLLSIPSENRHAHLLFAGKNGVIEKTSISNPDDTAAPPTYSLLLSKTGDTAPLEIMKMGATAEERTFFLGVTRK